jgi:hypothetical protein
MEFRQARVMSVSLVSLVLWAIASGAQEPSAGSARGRELYEQSCTGCHGRSVHDRKQRSAQSFADIRRFVEVWSGQIGAGWNTEQVTNVTLYLNERYYHYPCPESVCRGRKVSALDARPM